MAGTRLLIQATFTIEVFALVAIAIYLSITNDTLDRKYQLFPSWKRTSLIPSSHELSSLQSANVVIPWNIRLIITHSSNKKEKEIIEKAFDSGMNKIGTRNQHVVIHTTTSQTARGMCNDDNMNEDLSSLRRNMAREGEQLVVLIPQCPDSASFISIHDSGTVLARINRDEEGFINLGESRMSLENYITTHVVKAVGEVILPSNTNYSSSNESIIRKDRFAISISVIDEDPGSHGKIALEHHLSLGNAASHRIQTSLRPFLKKLSPLANFTVRSRTMLHDFSLSKNDLMVKSKGNRHEIINEQKLSPDKTMKEYYSVPLDEFKTLLDDKSLSFHRYVASHASPSTMALEFFVYVPSGDYTPLFFRQSNSTGVAADKKKLSAGMTLEQRGGMAIVNLQKFNSSAYDSEHHNDSNTEAMKDEWDQNLDRQLNIAISTFATQIRQIFGLPSLEPHRQPNANSRDSSGQASNLVSHLTTFDGVARWEVDSLLCHLIPIKYMYAVDKLCVLVNFINERRTTLPVFDNVGIKLTEAAELLKGAMHSSKNGNLPKSMELVNNALLLLSQVESDHTMIEELHFPFDHWLAVLAPLFMPLLLPMMFGLVREYKRYRKLKNAKTEQQSSAK